MQIDENAALYVISVAAELAGMHPQTLRQYDRMGLVTPKRAAGRGRRYSAEDVRRLRLIQQLSQEEGINLAGIRRILELSEEVRRAQCRASALSAQLRGMRERPSGADRVFAAGTSGDVVSIVHGRQRRRTGFAGALMPAGTLREAAGQ